MKTTHPTTKCLLVMRDYTLLLGLIFGLLGFSPLAMAEDPVYFADENLKLAVEVTLGKLNPTPTDMLALTELDARVRGITSLTGLEYALNLERLWLSENRISNLSPLSGLLNLEYLGLAVNQISDISVLSNLTNLTYLEMIYNQISDITALSGLNTLTDLGLGGNQISDISTLSGLTNLEHLSLSMNQITDITPLLTLTNLRRLGLNVNQINDIYPITRLTNLTSLAISNIGISDISELWRLTNLTDLEIGGNQITDISVLSQFPSLTRLWAGYNPLGGDISVLSGLTNLTFIDLTNAQISNISALSGLTNLTALELWYNQISDISAVSGLTNLTQLYLSHNQISDISAVSGLTNLTVLYLTWNQISDISALAAHTQLEYLLLDTNPLNADAYCVYLPLIIENNPGIGLFYDPPSGEDTDGDGILDTCDNCPDEVNPGQQDSDSDGNGDICDNCPANANPDNSDIDGDGAGDICDQCPDDPSNTCDAGRSAAASIPPETGGTVSTPDNGITMTIPPLALDEETSISITDSGQGTSFALYTNQGGGTAYYEVSIQPEGHVFNTPITITLRWPDADNDGIIDGTSIREDSLMVVKNGNAITNRCSQCSSGMPLCDRTQNYFAVQVMSLSDFALFQPDHTQIYVDANATGANDGSSWEDAYEYLQDALTAVEPNYDIWVAQGTYRPDEDTNHPDGNNIRTATFQLKNNVSLYGGFPTGGGLWESRDPYMYETILSGDINIPNDNNDNSYHVVTGSGTNSTAILDGLTITAGNANGEWSDIDGGGMQNIYGSPKIANCTFRGNLAYYEGGMYNHHSDPNITNCTFIGNSAVSSGGMGNIFSSPTLTNCTFSGNSGGSGGGMTNEWYSNPILVNCTFSGNSGYDGAGMCNAYSSPCLVNCTFSGNSADEWGGGIYDYNSSPVLANCTFSGNSADEWGGGIYDSSSSPTLTNCILWGNTSPTGPQIYNDGTGSPTVSYCDIEGSWAGVGNINADPRFIDADGPDNIFGTEDDNLRLLSNSPCIDEGNNTGVPADIADLDGDANKTEPTPLDLDLRPRFTDGDCNGSVIVDMGAFEFTSAYMGDFDSDCEVDFTDFAIQSGFWLTDEILVDISPTPAGNGIVDIKDLAVLCDNWLAGK
jgi:parallel beta-helix repeat protein